MGGGADRQDGDLISLHFSFSKESRLKKISPAFLELYELTKNSLYLNGDVPLVLLIRSVS
jgi:hypothetical protein